MPRVSSPAIRSPWWDLLETGIVRKSLRMSLDVLEEGMEGLIGTKNDPSSLTI